jgi:glycosyltransferase involved in cell wall biosynthesis
MSIVFITNYLTPYQAALFSRKNDVIITYTPTDKYREWGPLKTGARVEDVSGSRLTRRLYEILHASNSRADAYLIGGSARSPEFWFSIAVCRWRRAPFAIWMERPSASISLFRRNALRLALGKTGIILGVGTIATVFYRQLISGIKVSNFPYSYGRGAPAGAGPRDNSKPDPTVTALFIGSDWMRKGFDILLAAIAKMPFDMQSRLELRVAGLSEIPAEIKGAAMTQPAAQVAYLGYLKPEEIRRELSSADVLVVASRHDGWAVVVEEAMAQGTPVIASDAVGAAADLVVDDYSGYRFPSENSGALATALEAVMSRDACERPLSAGARATVVRHRDLYNIETLDRAIRGAS